MEKQITKPTWLKLDEKEVEKIIEDLAKQGMNTEKIGLALRDNYGIPTMKVYGKKISQILKEKGIKAKGSLENTQENVEKLKKHFAKNKQDMKAKYALIKKTAISIKLKNYQEKKTD